MCDRVGFIRAGKLISEQSIERLSYTAANTFDISFTGPAPLRELKLIRNASVTAHTQSHVTVSLRGDLSALFRVLARHRVASINQRDINLEEEFLSYYTARRKK
jgi:ABC-type multidrug transport system ATPase subunit